MRQDWRIPERLSGEPIPAYNIFLRAELIKLVTAFIEKLATGKIVSFKV